MSKAENIFKGADFSTETDFKDRLRTQLFGGEDNSSSRQVKPVFKVYSGKGRSNARELSMDELDLVTAAGDKAMLKNTNAEEILQKTKNTLDKDLLDQFKTPISGGISDRGENLS